MPGKHVRFVGVPSTPLSSSSGSSIASSPSPLTPPTILYSPASVKSPLSLPAPLGAAVVHPVLARTSGSATPLSWDMSLPAEFALPNLPRGPQRITEELVAEAATNPPLPSLAIICDRLPWLITVTPTPHTRWSRPYVTVGDVLHALYRVLRLGATEPELNALQPAQHDGVRDAYVRRYRRVIDAREREVEKSKGIKRVDYLGDHRAFLGLSMVAGGLPAKGLAPGAVWALHVTRA